MFGVRRYFTNGTQAIYGTLFALLAIYPYENLIAEETSYRDPNTGLWSWQVKENGFGLRLLQLLPDFVSALYSSRELPPEVVKDMANYCVFGTFATNESNEQVSYRVADWRYVTPDGKTHRIKTKSEWLADWRKMGVTYRWSILPDDQTFEPGDWSQGFTTIALSPDSVFDFKYSWTYKGKTFQRVIKGVRCAPREAPTK